MALKQNTPRGAVTPRVQTPKLLPEAPQETPEWLTGTPHSAGYCLEMWTERNGNLQTVEVSRTEYIELKAHLARIRGYQAPTSLITDAGGDFVPEVV